MSGLHECCVRQVLAVWDHWTDYQPTSSHLASIKLPFTVLWNYTTTLYIYHTCCINVWQKPSSACCPTPRKHYKSAISPESNLHLPYIQPVAFICSDTSFSYCSISSPNLQRSACCATSRITQSTGWCRSQLLKPSTTNSSACKQGTTRRTLRRLSKLRFLSYCRNRYRL